MIELLDLKFSRRWQTNKIESDWSNSPRQSSSRQFRSPSSHGEKLPRQGGLPGVVQRVTRLSKLPRGNEKLM